MADKKHSSDLECTDNPDRETTSCVQKDKENFTEDLGQERTNEKDFKENPTFDDVPSNDFVAKLDNVDVKSFEAGNSSSTSGDNNDDEFGQFSFQDANTSTFESLIPAFVEDRKVPLFSQNMDQILSVASSVMLSNLECHVLLEENLSSPKLLQNMIQDEMNSNGTLRSFSRMLQRSIQNGEMLRGICSQSKTCPVIQREFMISMLRGHHIESKIHSSFDALGLYNEMFIPEDISLMTKDMRDQFEMTRKWIVQELVFSEEEYLSNLRTLVNTYMRVFIQASNAYEESRTISSSTTMTTSPSNTSTNTTTILPPSSSPTNAEPSIQIPLSDSQVIFSNVESLIEGHTEMLNALGSRLSQWSSEQRIGDIFVEMAPLFEHYCTYCRNHDASMKTLEIYLENGVFGKLWKATITVRMASMKTGSFLSIMI